MSSNLVSNVTISGNLLVLGTNSNVTTANATVFQSLFFNTGLGAFDYQQVAGGRTHTAVLLSNGTVRTFGGNDQGQLGVNDTATRSTIVQVWGISSSATVVACGAYHTAVLLADGTVRTFGSNQNGQLGVNDTTSRQTPVQVIGISSVGAATAVACGAAYTAVLLNNGTVWTFGRNEYGQLGVGDTTSRLTPVQVSAITSATAIACGLYHTSIVLSDGTVRTFGLNISGQLGVNDGTSRQTPVQVWGISSSAVAVAGGLYHTSVLLADGTVRTFGKNDFGQLGINIPGVSRQTPVQVWGISSSATAITCGRFHTSVLLGNGTVMTIGNNGYGQLGVNDTTSRQTPVQVWGISSSAVSIADGQYITAIVLSDGTVRTFGRNDFGQLGLYDFASRLTPVSVFGPTYAGVVGKVAGGASHTAIVMSDGTVRTFGQNDQGQLGVNDTTSRLTPVQVWGISSSAVAVAAAYHTAVLLADGTVRAFGSNDKGQLGVNDTISRLTPVQVLGISSSATSVACGKKHTAILLSNGTVQTFGYNNNGQLGVNDTTDRSTPVQVWGISTSAVAIACGAGSYHIAVLLADGTVRTFGNNSQGQLGVNDTTSRLTPVQVWGISSSATAIACGQFFTAVLLADGTVRTFGLGNYGQLGVNDTVSRLTPVQVWGISSSAVAIACGRVHTIVLLADGSIRTVGNNGGGGLGVNDTTSRLTPVQVWGISSSAVAIAGGYYSTAVILADGTVRTFGSNDKGQLGVNDTTSRLTPVTVIRFNSAVQGKIASGAGHTAVLMANGTVRTFGSNNNGQLGVNDLLDRSTPVQVWGISSSATAVACGLRHTAVLLADGTVRAFGENGNGQLGVNDRTRRNTPVQVWGISSSAMAVAGGMYHTSVLLTDGTVRTVGGNNNGQLGVNDTTERSTPVQVWGISSSAVAVASGGRHTAVLLADGTVRTFGLNDRGQLGINDTTSRLTPVQVWGISSSAVAVACGRDNTAILLADGTVRTFGFSNSFGGLGINSTDLSRLTPVQVWGISSSAVAISAGYYFMAVLLADGTVRTFGYNTYAALGVNDTTNRLTPVQVWGVSSSAVAIASGWYNTVVLLADGTVRTFGWNNQGALGVNDLTDRSTPVQVFGISSSAVGITGGFHFGAVILADGTVRTFGSNDKGQLGVNDTTSRLTPVTVIRFNSAVQGKIAAGEYNTAVLLSDGTVRTFGTNSFGQLGVNDIISRLTPVQVWGISSSAVAVACAGHITVLLANGTVRTFGRNDQGQLGLNDTTSRLTPVQVWGISSSATAIANGYLVTAVLLADGTVRTFGYNTVGQLGINVVGGVRYTPVQVWGISSSAVAVASGRYHMAVLLADGTVQTFGQNTYGQLGVGDNTDRPTPVQVWGISSSAVAVACGQNYTVVLLTNGTVRTFGYNGDGGQLGVNDTSNRNTPVQVWGISSSATAVTCGWAHTIVLLADGTVRTFGNNPSGLLGVNDTTSRLTPVQVWGISSSASAVAGGWYNTSILLQDGTVRTVGSNAYGQLGINDTTSRLTPVQVTSLFSTQGYIANGAFHTVIAMNDGTVRAVGYNNSGQLGVNDTTNRLTPVTVLNITSSTAVAGGYYHTAVLLADGTVRTFGRGAQGQLGVNDTTQRNTPVQVWGISSSATAVACGGYHTAILLANGTVWTFGLNGFGQLGVNDILIRPTPVQIWGISSSATAIACGYNHTAVLLANGTVLTFGNNPHGGLGVNDTTSRLTPVQVWGISSSATAITCGLYITSVLLADGTVRTFGRNTVGQLGLNDKTSRLTPVQVFGISSSATAVACGNNQTAVLLANGTVRTFGQNANGQLGVGDTANRSTPVQVWGISSSAVAIATGPNAIHATILLSDGSVRTVGYNTYGQLGVADTVNRWIPVKVGVGGNKVAGGNNHTGLVSNDGTVRTFGTNSSGQLGLGDTTQRNTPVQVTAFTSATVASCGSRHTTVLLADGTIRTFGSNNYGQLGVNDTTQRNTPVQVWGISSSAVAVTVGGRDSTAVVLADGTVRTWGFNQQGQLGVNDTTSRLTPVQVLNITSATAVAMGFAYTAVLLADGTVRTFGQNAYGQLGTNGGDTLTPVQVWGISSSATGVACGPYHTAILLADGTVRTFGQNTNGQLGVNDMSNRPTPVQVWGISSSAVAVAVGYYFTAVLLADGTVRTFGINSNGQLGVNDTTQRNTPVQVFGISSSATGLAIGPGSQTCAILLQDGTVRTFGNNGSGQLGVNDTTSRLTPVQVVSSPGAAGLAAGGTHMVVLLADSTVRTFGRNAEGQLGVNDATQRNTPVQVWGISSSAITTAGGTYHTAVLLADGTVRTFGSNSQGQLGVNDQTDRSTPVQVWAISSSATSVAGGRFHSAVLLADGTVRTFGKNVEGQCGDNQTSFIRNITPTKVWGISSSATAISCGWYHTVVLLADGTVRAFGSNSQGHLGVNDTTQRNTPVQVWGISSSAVAVAGGSYHTAVLLADGTVRTFGFNASGQLGVNDTTNRLTPVQVWGISSSATAVACGRFNTSILLADGTVRVSGRNDFGQLGVNDATSRLTPVQVWGISSSAVAVAGGAYFMAILLADGTVRTFGLNSSGQLGVGGTTSRLTPVTVLNITTAGGATTYITNATAIVTPLSSAATVPSVVAYLGSANTITTVTTFTLRSSNTVSTAFFSSPLSTAQTTTIVTFPYVQFSGVNLGPVVSPFYQLELSTDYARKLTTSTWATGSDERIKNDVESANISRCIEIVQNLDLKRFAWNFPDGSQPNDSHSLGWIAQDVERIFPNSVETGPAHGLEDFKTLNTDQIIKVMWGALRKLRADLKAQTNGGSA